MQSTLADDPTEEADPNGQHFADPMRREQIENTYREAAQHYMRVMVEAMNLLRRESVEWWGMQFALGTSHCAGRTMSDVAQALKITRAALSKRATEFCRRLEIEPSPYMKSEESQSAYREARNAQI